MKVIIVCLLVGLFGTLGLSSPFPESRNVSHAFNDKNCGTTIYDSDTRDRIIGGRFANRGEFPWMVSLRETSSWGWEHACGAAILNEHWIVTAAHCFDIKYPKAYRFDVVVGLHTLSQVEDGLPGDYKVYKLSDIIIHEKYIPDKDPWDIALVRTIRPIDFAGSKGYINTVCLPKPDSDPKGYATVSGWGHTKENGENSDTLKTVDVPILDRAQCNERYDDDPYDDLDEILESMICAGSKGKDSCQNDSGGPLVQYDRSGKATLIGVVSYGIGCGLRYYPGVYTRVSYFLDWIQKTAV